MEIPRLNDLTYQETLANTKLNFNNQKEEIKETLKAVIGCMPHKNELIVQFIVDLNKEYEIKEMVKEIFLELLTNSNVEIAISTVFYAKLLDFDLHFDEFKVNSILNSPFKGESISISEVEKIKILQYLEKIKQFVNLKEEEEGLEYFFCISIIKNFKFSIGECLRELKVKDKIVFSSIVLLSEEEDVVYLTSLLLKIISPENHCLILPLFPQMEKSFRDWLIAMLLENHNSLSIEFVEGMKTFIDEETVDILVRFNNPNLLTKFIPEYKDKTERISIKRVQKKDFLIDKDKEKFFRDFCLLGSPSISHFLSYLEIYKDYFKLTKEEQKQFIKIFYSIFVNQKSFSRIILSKMVQFGIIEGGL